MTTSGGCEMKMLSRGVMTAIAIALASSAAAQDTPVALKF